MARCLQWKATKDKKFCSKRIKMHKNCSISRNKIPNFFFGGEALSKPHPCGEEDTPSLFDTFGVSPSMPSASQFSPRYATYI